MYIAYLSRYFGITHTHKQHFWTEENFRPVANECIQGNQNILDVYNQGIMEFGALHCTPKNPELRVLLRLSNYLSRLQ